MDIQTRKINFVQEFLRLRNVKLIERLEKILMEDKAREYEANLKPLSVEDAKKGNVVSARELRESLFRK
ncbi:MAG: hypothetical protein WAW07_09925 [Bacteroidales bacterium]